VHAIELASRQRAVKLDRRRLRAAIAAVLADSPYTRSTVSLAVVDDATIHQLNREYLDHDWPTDVLSFVLDDDPPALEGELIVSADTAVREAPRYGWGGPDELLLYVIHGCLHLVGCDDQTPTARRKMRRLEGRYLAQFDLKPHNRRRRAARPAGGSRRA